ncbi:MAG: aldo/keto reductase [Candidatus Paceibacteria bacterium]
MSKASGVSNFTIGHLKEAFQTGGRVDVNQVEFHPSLYQKELKEFCDANDVHMTAYSPLARGQDLELPSIRSIAEERNVPAGQVIINWIRQKDMSVIPKSTNPDRIESNFGALNWTLTEHEISQIDQEHTDNRLINPEFAEFEA